MEIFYSYAWFSMDIFYSYTLCIDWLRKTKIEKKIKSGKQKALTPTKLDQPHRIIQSNSGWFPMLKKWRKKVKSWKYAYVCKINKD